MHGRVDIDVIKSGPRPLFNLEPESLLCNHLSTMAEVGFGYSRQETLNLATDYAIHLGLKSKENPSSLPWLHTILSNWPELRVVKPKSREIARAKSATKPAISRYFKELKSIIDKYKMIDKPERIFNIDEQVLSLEHKPPKIISG